VTLGEDELTVGSTKLVEEEECTDTVLRRRVCGGR
jgi:hypothetical protein